MNTCQTCKHKKSVCRIYYDGGREERFIRCQEGHRPPNRGAYLLPEDNTVPVPTIGWLDTAGGCCWHEVGE